MNTNLRQILIKMSKICIYGMIVQISAYSFAFAVSSRAQDKSVNAIQVQLDLKSPVQLEKVFKQIEKSTDFHFSYVDEQLNSSSYAVDINNSQILLGDLLMNISRQTDLSFRRVNDHIFIAKKEEGIEPIVEDIEMALKITGKITDEKGEPLPGATVLEKGTTNGTTTDLDGKFQLNSSENAILVISFVGYETREVSVNNRSVIDVQLGVDSEQLEEVVVVGYGTQRKSDVTGSLVSLSRDDFDKQPITRIDQALQGRTAGVQVTQSSGAPGSGYKIRIRGVNSISGSNNPLYVIDGMVVGSINSMNINDIQSMEVLKDASATAIYGSRGANGVVLITTKNGNKGPVKMDFDAFYGVSNISRRLDIMSAADFAEGVNASDGFEVFTDEEIADLRANGGEDWQDRVFQNAMFSNYQLSLSGGSDDVNYYISGNISNQEGAVISQDYNRYSFRSNLNAKMNEKMDLGLNLYGSREERDGRVASIANAATFDPSTPVYDENGDYNFVSLKNVATAKLNPVLEANESIRENYRNQLIANGFFNFSITDDLVLNISGGLEQLEITNNDYNPIIFGVGKAEVQRTSISRFQNTNRLTYTKRLENHRIQVDAIHEQQYIKNNGMAAESEQFFSDVTTYKNLALGGIQNNDNSFRDESLQSFVGRANYSFRNKYLVTGTIRADGSSKFREDQRWGVFPSGSFAWKISEEGFLQSVEVINNLKLRASYGITGSQAISALATRARGVVGTGYNYPFDGGTATVGIAPSNRIANPDLTWEETAQTNFGVDVGIWTSRVNFSFDYYKKNTTDLLLDVVLPQFVGANTITQNVGEVENQGFDIALNLIPVETDDLVINTSFNVSKNSNKVISLYGDAESIEVGQPYVNFLATQVRVGQPISSFQGYKFDGVYQLGEEDLASDYNRQVGDAKYVDVNEDGIISSDDITLIGNGNADFTWGWNTTISYKSFDLNVLFVGSQGNDVYNFTRGIQMGLGSGIFHAVHQDFMNRWTPENPSSIPSGYDGYQLLSSQFLEDGSYTRLKNISLTYSFDNLFSDTRRSLQVYASAENLLLITNYTGYDPEPSSSRDSDVDLGIDWNAYPVPRSFTIGVRAKF
ncbi:MAG: SusC/RagA family TonB-linked outer membrane protein [Phycisphaeraceae bacterium]|nr:SusC/RagA family TonB-linked outer membrane protein [Phycisphaeraceae bacterium]